MLKTAVVTGGASGIGRRTVERLLAEGWTVWSLDVADERLAEHAAQLDVGERFAYRRCDVSDVQSVQAAFAEIATSTRKLDALICSAGVIRIASLAQQTPEDVDRMLNVNIKGVWSTVRAAIPLLQVDASPERPSRVVIVGSIGGIRPKVGSGFYAATKAAIHVLTGIFAAELAPSGVIVNAVAPGTVNTPMVAALAGVDPSSGYKPSGDSPLGRVAEPDDIADVILFYLGDAAKFVNGAILPVDGGTRAAFVKQ